MTFPSNAERFVEKQLGADGWLSIRTIHQTAVEILIRKRKSNYKRRKRERKREWDGENWREPAEAEKKAAGRRLEWFLQPPKMCGS